MEIDEVKSIIRYHQRILALCDDLKEIFVPVVIWQFMLSSVLLCVVGFQLLSFVGQAMMICYIAYFSAISIQIFLFSYAGTQITYESSAIGDAIYCSGWYTYPPRVRKWLRFAIECSQKGVKMKAAFYEMSMHTFISVI